MNGWTIKVTVPDKPVRVYPAAVSEPTIAVILVHETLGTSIPLIELETIKQIPARVLEELGTKTGEIKDVTDKALAGAHL
jgi:hypothetical protein